MANRYTVKYLTHQATLAEGIPKKLQENLEVWLEAINQQMSVYRDDSTISHFNQLKAGEGLDIGIEFAEVVRAAQRLHRQTEGGLDITLAPLIDFWGYGAKSSSSPADEVLTRLHAMVGMDKFSLQTREGKPFLQKQHSEVRIDVSAIAKGYAVDGMAHILDTFSIDNYLIDIGGDMRAKGVNAQGKPWQVAIENPILPEKSLVISLSNQSIATSGNYRHCHHDGSGQLIHHVISPMTFMPTPADLLSITVIADSVMTADGLATGLYTLGVERALILADVHQLPICLLTKNTEERLEYHCSTAFLPFLIKPLKGDL
ncbi:MAG: FAD:protein FMN transferase [[Pasteurella] aerogenes]|nr:FAD:protein FMN transferase [[Pasteurella] aerogenes]